MDAIWESLRVHRPPVRRQQQRLIITIRNAHAALVRQLCRGDGIDLLSGVAVPAKRSVSLTSEVKCNVQNKDNEYSAGEIDTPVRSPGMLPSAIAGFEVEASMARPCNPNYGQHQNPV